MIKAIGVQNTRIFEGPDWNFPLHPLTVLCGTNNSGKSTLLKVLPLLSQSMGIRESYGMKEDRLRFVGYRVDLGDYYSFVSHNDIQRDISITLITESTMPAHVARLLRSLKTSDERTVTEPSEEEVPYTLTSHFHFGVISEREETSDPSIFTSTESIEETISPSPRGFHKGAVYELSVDEEKLLSWEVIYSGLNDDGDPEFHLFVQQDYFDDVTRLQKIVVDRESKEGYVKVRATLQGLIPMWLIAQLSQDEPDNDSGAEEQERWVVERVPTFIDSASRDLRRAIAAVDYIGPMRSPAQRYYIARPDISPPLDPAGEFLPYVLKDIDRYEAWHIAPDLRSAPKREPLARALNTWLHYIRTGESPTEEILEEEFNIQATKVLVELKIRSVLGNELHALVDSGFGYSQLFPILVRGLLADQGNTLIVEQPELHLNPAVQVRVAKFLVAMARAGKQVLIETHSEHVVNTIRVLTAEDESGELASMCGILYIDVDAESKRPIVHELSIKPDGTVPKWPQQFFGEAASLTGRLLRAQKRFRKQARKKE